MSHRVLYLRALKYDCLFSFIASYSPLYTMEASQLAVLFAQRMAVSAEQEGVTVDNGVGAVLEDMEDVMYTAAKFVQDSVEVEDPDGYAMDEVLLGSIHEASKGVTDGTDGSYRA